MLNQNWAQEIIFSINEDGDLIISVYPGNTKSQGDNLFWKDPVFSKEIKFLDNTYLVTKTHHISFRTSFQRYITGLWFGDDKLKQELYTRNNFYKYTGRKKRGVDWNEIETLLDNYLNFDWKNACKWNEKIISSGKNQFDISFGYEVFLKIPFEKLKELDTDQSNLSKLTTLITKMHQFFSYDLLI